jgi:4-hydroxythreonine-4-phosphate dehydrogenase
MGDPAGIGPEVVLKAIADPAVLAACRPVVFGDAALLREAARRLSLPADWLPPITDNRKPKTRLRSSAGAQLVDLGGARTDLLFAAQATRESGAASLRYIEAAATAARDGLVAAVATAPIHKQAIAMAGSRFAGHTDLLAHFFGVERVVMMFDASLQSSSSSFSSSSSTLPSDTSERAITRTRTRTRTIGPPPGRVLLRVALVTHHIRLADVPDTLSTEDIVATARLTEESLRRHFGIAEPRLAVCGLNPHASDGSRFGDEELRIIEPAIVELHQAGIRARGPIPPDTCFLRAIRGEFDAVIAMYHDQGLIPLKLLAFEDAVNITLGLPIVRTSPDHGTAYDIAGKGIASPRSMTAAILLAARMSLARRAKPES